MPPLPARTGQRRAARRHGPRALLAAALLATLAAPAPALAQTVVVVNPANPVQRLTAEQAAQYFLGRSSSLTPLDLAGRSTLRARFYQQLAGKDPDQVKAIWSKVVFTGRGFPPREYNNSDDIKRAVAADPVAIAYLDQSAVDDTVRVVLVLP